MCVCERMCVESIVSFFSLCVDVNCLTLYTEYKHRDMNTLQGGGFPTILPPLRCFSSHLYLFPSSPLASSNLLSPPVASVPLRSSNFLSPLPFPLLSSSFLQIGRAHV